MNPILAPLGLILGGMYLLTKDTQASPKPVPLTPDAAALITDTVGGVRIFKPEIAAGILGFLGQSSLVPVPVQGGAPGLLFKVVPGTGSGISAKDAAVAAHSQGLLVLGSLTLPVLNPTIDKLVMFVPPSQRGLANTSSTFAILIDAQGVVLSPAAPPFDPEMDAELVKQVNALLADPKADPEALERSADQLDASGFPIAAKALRARAKALRLKNQLSDASAGGTPFHIRKGPGGIAVDLPFFTAEYYTGQGSRFREIAAINPGMVITSNGLNPWIAGSDILLPLSWGVRNKPLRAPLGIPAKGETEKADKVAHAPTPDGPQFGPPEAPSPPADDVLLDGRDPVDMGEVDVELSKFPPSANA